MQFEVFRKSYRRNEAIEHNKSQLKDKYEKAKEIGKRINQRKEKIAKFKTCIEKVFI